MKANPLKTNPLNKSPMKKISTTVCVLLTLLLSPLTMAASNAQITQISENVFAVFLNHYHSLVVIGDKGVLITDPANPARAKALQTEIAKLTDLPVTEVVLSHEHYDHVGGTEVFKEADIYAHQATRPVFRIDTTGQAPASVDQYVQDNTTLKIGETQVDLLHAVFFFIQAAKRRL